MSMSSTTVHSRDMGKLTALQKVTFKIKHHSNKITRDYTLPLWTAGVSSCIVDQRGRGGVTVLENATAEVWEKELIAEVSDSKGGKGLWRHHVRCVLCGLWVNSQSTNYKYTNTNVAQSGGHTRPRWSSCESVTVNYGAADLCWTKLHTADVSQENITHWL